MAAYVALRSQMYFSSIMLSLKKCKIPLTKATGTSPNYDRPWLLDLFQIAFFIWGRHKKEIKHSLYLQCSVSSIMTGWEEIVNLINFKRPYPILTTWKSFHKSTYFVRHRCNVKNDANAVIVCTWLAKQEVWDGTKNRFFWTVIVFNASKYSLERNF